MRWRRTMADKLDTAGTPRWVHADRLIVAPEYQRPRREVLIRKIKKEFDPDALVALVISKREDGTLVIMDGQQRWTALMEMGWGDQQVPAVVYEGLTVEEESLLFYRVNGTRSRLRPMELHRSALLGGETRAVEVE